MASNADFQGSATLDQRADQIRRAATGRGWTMATQAPGVLRGTLKLRGHTAVVDVRFDAARFSVNYIDSADLNYDGASIHPKYNDWVRYLEIDIVRESGRRT